MASEEKTGVWAGMSPKNRRSLVMVGVAACGMGLLWLFLNATPDPPAQKKTTSTLQRNVLTGEDPHALGIDAMGSEVDKNREEIESLRGQIEDMEANVGRQLDQIAGAIERTGLQIHQIDSQTRDGMTELQQRQAQARAASAQAGGGEVSIVPATAVIGAGMNGMGGMGGMGGMQQSQQPSGPQLPGNAAPAPVLRVREQRRPENLWANPPQVPNSAQPAATAAKAGRSPAGTERPAPAIRVIVADEPEQKPEKDEPKESDFMTLPTGSIISGVLLSGVDGVTGLQGASEPLPLLMRVKHNAILPNRFKADVRECFLVGSSRAELSTERVMVRGETFSCVNADGGIIETDIKSYAAGEDGKAGIRGRLVHRSGQLVARAALAGLISGLSEAFQPVAVTALNTSGTSNIQYQRADTKQALETGAYGGANTAAEKLADHWLDLADKVLPAIEVESGREVDMILLKQMRLRVTGGAVRPEDALKKTSVGRLYAVGSTIPDLDGAKQAGALK